MAKAKATATDVAFYSLTTIVTALLVWCIYAMFFYAPVEKTMGIVQKIFYFHAPCAYAMYIGATACFIGSVGYLLKRTDVWDSLARAGAEMSVVFGAIVMVTGPLWGAKAWGYFWVWDPRLTTTLLSLLIYIAYIVLRAFAGDGPGERKFAAALGILGAANLPIIHFSVEKWAGQHPKVIMAKGGGGRAAHVGGVPHRALHVHPLRDRAPLGARAIRARTDAARPGRRGRH
jgi:heme exporter protein C